MIHAIYDRQRLRLTVEGHAGAGEKGKDIVCAAVSVLVCTLGANVERLAQMGQVTRLLVRMEPGRAKVWAEAAKGFRARTQALFDDLCNGFALLADRYPEYVNLDIKGPNGFPRNL